MRKMKLLFVLLFTVGNVFCFFGQNIEFANNAMAVTHEVSTHKQMDNSPQVKAVWNDTD